MSKITLNSRTPSLAKQEDGEDRKSTLTAVEPEPVDDREDGEVEVQDPCVERARMERRLVRKIDWRLCTIAGVLCSLNLLDRSACP
jgi:hypothetical protein